MQRLRSHRLPPVRAPLVRYICLVLAAALCGAAGIATWVLITGHLGTTGGQALASVFSAAVCAVAGLAGASVLDRADHRRLIGLLTIGLSASVVVLALIFIWTLPVAVTLPRALGVCSALLAASVHACLMLGRLRDDDAPAVRRLSAAAVAFSTSCALLIAGALAFAGDSPLGGSWRVLGVLAVLGALCTLLAPLVRRLGRGTDRRTPDRSVGASC